MRDAVSRETHAAWRPAADDPDQVARLQGQGTTRVSDLLPDPMPSCALRRAIVAAG